MTPWPAISEAEDDPLDGYAPAQPARVDMARPVSHRLALAKWLFALRNNRPFAKFRDTAGEPSWDILLDLYIGELAGRKTSVTSACIGLRAPPTTALRHLNLMCEAERIERYRDEKDARRCWLRLAPEVRDEIDRYLLEAIEDIHRILTAPL